MNVWLALIGCSGQEPGKDESTPAGTDTAEACAPVAPPDERTPASAPRPRRRVAGAMGFTVDFDADAEAAGYVDCGYTRTYAGDEFTDQPWLCAGCEAAFATTTDVDEYDCYQQIGTAADQHPEWIGFGGGEFFRAVDYANTELTSYCAGDCDGLSFGGRDVGFTWGAAGNATLDYAGTYALSVEGSFEVTDDPSGAEVTELDGHRTEPYACGWPTNSPGGPSPWFAELGSTFPNVRLDDQCGEAFDLWDLRGYYVILVADTTADTDPGAYDPFRRVVENLRADCIPVELVVVLGDGYLNGETTQGAVEDFAALHGLTGPVLGERGVTYSLLSDVAGLESLFPGGGIVAPDGALIDVLTVYDPVRTFEDRIRADAE